MSTHTTDLTELERLDLRLLVAEEERKDALQERNEEIRSLVKSGSCSQAAIAGALGMSREAVRQIVGKS